MNNNSHEKYGVLISVIVPVYRVEGYLRDCLDSILRQTWQNLDVIVIDDGSPDTCGTICDYYAQIDTRVRVFHTENRGLSAARNLGIEKANETKSEFLVFVDSDDWLEDNMIETMASVAIQTNAEIVICGEYNEFQGETSIVKYRDMCFTGEEAAKAALSDKISNHTMNKLWRKECFAKVRFPEGRVYEDLATNYIVFSQCKCIITISNVLYHYRNRVNSIVHTPTLKNTIDFWLACRERYDYCSSEIELKNEYKIINVCEKRCVSAAGMVWRAYNEAPVLAKKQNNEMIKDIASFIRNEIPTFGRREWPIHFRVCAFLTRHINLLSSFITWVMYKAWKLFGKKQKQLYTIE